MYEVEKGKVSLLLRWEPSGGQDLSQLNPFTIIIMDYGTGLCSTPVLAWHIEYQFSFVDLCSILVGCHPNSTSFLSRQCLSERRIAGVILITLDYANLDQREAKL